MSEAELPKFDAEKRGSAAWLAWLRGHKGAIGAGLGAFLAIGFVGVLLLPPLDEPTLDTGSLPFGTMEKWKSPKIQRGDPRDLIRSADSLAGVDAGRPISYDDDDVGDAKGKGKKGPETVAAAAGPVAGGEGAAAGGRAFASKSLASLNDEKAFGGKRGGGSSASSQAMAAAPKESGRTGMEARGPIARAQRRLSSLVRRFSRAGGGLLGGAMRAFGMGQKQPYAAGSTTATTFAAGGSGADGTAGSPAGGIGPMDGSSNGTNSNSGPGTTKLTPPPAVGPSKAVNPAQKPKDVKCAIVKGAMADFWSAFDKIQNVNKRFHSTGEADKDLLVPLMERTAIKYGEFDTAINKALTVLNAVPGCQYCDDLTKCQVAAQQLIGTGNGSGIARELQDVVRGGQKGLSVCAPRGFENPGSATTCFENGLETISHDLKAKELIGQYLALSASYATSCKADETKGDAKEKGYAKKANEEWGKFVAVNIPTFQLIYDHVKQPWCDGDKPCAPIRNGQLMGARTALHNLEGSAAALSEFMGGMGGYVGRISKAKRHVADTIGFHGGITGDDGRNVFRGVNSEDKAAQEMDGLDVEFEAAMSKCGLVPAP